MHSSEVVEKGELVTQPVSVQDKSVLISQASIIKELLRSEWEKQQYFHDKIHCGDEVHFAIVVVITAAAI